MRLTVGEETLTTPAEVKADPRSSVSAADLKAQFDLLLGINRKLTEVHQQIERIREVRRQLADLRKRTGDDANGKPIVDAAKALDKKMTAIEEALYQTKNESRQHPLNYPIRLNDKLASLGDSISTGDATPTAQSRAVYQELVGKIDAQLAQRSDIWAKDLPALNQLVQEQKAPAVKVMTPTP